MNEWVTVVYYYELNLEIISSFLVSKQFFPILFVETMVEVTKQNLYEHYHHRIVIYNWFIRKRENASFFCFVSETK